MSLKKNLSFLLATVLLAACTGNNSKPACTNENSCINDKNCQCWCSVKCGFRDKKSDDRPVYVENDSNGKHCYCKQWDLDNYDMKCANPSNTDDSMQQGMQQKSSNY